MAIEIGRRQVLTAGIAGVAVAGLAACSNSTGASGPTEEELAICRPFVERHLQLFNPKVIILVGATAMNAIIETSETISKIRGQFLDFAPQFLANKTKIFTIFHPSFLMRQSAKKRLTWLDMLNLQKFIKNNYEE